MFGRRRHDEYEEEKQEQFSTMYRSAVIGGPAWLALGAVAMYFFDPDGGNRRRAHVRDKIFGTFNQTGINLRKTAEYSRKRTAGLMARTRGLFSREEADDWKICQRVRSALGRVVSHPSAIVVNSSFDGVVTLRGHVLAHELNGLLRSVWRVRGVRDVINELDVHKQAGDIPDLQGGIARPGQRHGLMEENWDPFTRLLTTLGGAGLAFWGLARRDMIGLLAAGVGAGFAARGLTNLPAKRLTGIGAGRRAVDVQKTITIRAPIDRVFGFFANYQNFPQFMSNVREVRAGGNGRSHWVVAGPMGIHLSWDADLTDYVPNQVIAWRSVEGASVENAGIMRFQEENGGTRVDIKLAYNPPAGAIGHFLARLFGADPKSEMDADLARVKTAMETGHLPRDAAQPTQREMAGSMMM